MKKWILALLFGSICFAGTNNLPVESPGVVQLDHINKFQTALVGDFVPRNSLGTPGDTVANLGSTTYRWNALYAKQACLQNDSNSNAVCLSAPSGVLNPFTIRTPPYLPPGSSTLTLDPNGQIELRAPAAGATTVSASSGADLLNYSTVSDNLPHDLTNLSTSLTTYGGPVQLQMVSTALVTEESGLYPAGALSNNRTGRFSVIFYMDGSPIGQQAMGSANSNLFVPCSAFSHFITNIPAGVHTFSASAQNVDLDASGSTVAIYVIDCALAAYEI